MKKTFKLPNLVFVFILLTVFVAPHSLMPQSIATMDRQAQEYFDNKEFSKAVALWLNILDLSPENREVQKKVEMLYEMKQKKDLELERAKYNYKVSRMEIVKNRADDITLEKAEKNLANSKSRASVAFKSFIIAYRIEPRDPEMQLLRQDMQKLEKIIASEEKKLRISIARRIRAKELFGLAVKAVDESRFKDALGHYEEILSFMPENIEAAEGKRQATIAIENILRYENIRKFTISGIALFNAGQYSTARQDFMSVLQLDPENNDAEDYIDRIDSKINEKKRYEQRLSEAGKFYLSGMRNLKDNSFDNARDDFENTLALVENYKDARARLNSIPGLRKAYSQREKARRLRIINTEFQNGMISLTEGKYQDAISSFEKTLELDPANKLAAVYIIRAKDARKQIEEEIVDQNSPYFDVVESLVLSGNKLFAERKFLESRKRWEQILELFPKNKLATENILKCELELNPGQRAMFIKRFISQGEEFLKKREYREAKRKFDLVKSLNSRYPGIDDLIKRAERRQIFSGSSVLSGADKAEVNRRYSLGMAYYRRGGKANISRALTELRWVAAKDPGNITAVVSVNKIEAPLRSGGAVGETKKTGLTPQQERLVRQFYYRGINYYSNNDFKRAIREWRKVLAIDPGHTRARNNIRKCLVLLGR